MKDKFDQNFATVEGKKDLEKQTDEDDLMRETLREMQIDNDKVLPNKEHRKWMAAQAHVFNLSGQLDDAKVAADL